MRDAYTCPSRPYFCPLLLRKPGSVGCSLPAVSTGKEVLSSTLTGELLSRDGALKTWTGLKDQGPHLNSGILISIMVQGPVGETVSGWN
ncbi:Cmrf35-Like Molecule 7 [Manis pentadactyla]|nr:Cmrf35-Like Molecule 7 [Manis pentadactyla]